MGRSVIINTPYPTVEEVAAELGIRGRRLKTLLALVKEDLAKPAPKPRKDETVSVFARKKAAEKRARPTS